MNFIWWLIKKWSSPIIELWKSPGTDSEFSGPIVLCLITLLISGAIDMVFINYKWMWSPVGEGTFSCRLLLAWFAIWGVVLCFNIIKYVYRLYLEYRTENPKQKRKQKRTIEDEIYAQCFEDDFWLADDGELTHVHKD